MSYDITDFIMKVDTNISLDSVILSQENKDKIAEFIKETQFADKLASYGLEPMNRLMFYGDSGCGKTYLGKALSNHLGYKMLYVDITSALAGGNIGDNLRHIFKYAETQKSIIFLDEIDSIAWARDGANMESGDIRRAINSLFQLIDQMPYTSVLLCATNMLHRIDPAFKARFNMMLQFKKNEMNMRDTIKKFINPKFKIIEDVDDVIEGIVIRRNTLSYRELQFIVNRNMKKAIMSGTDNISLNGIFKDIAIACNMPINL